MTVDELLGQLQLVSDRGNGEDDIEWVITRPAGPPGDVGEIAEIREVTAIDEMDYVQIVIRQHPHST